MAATARALTLHHTLSTTAPRTFSRKGELRHEYLENSHGRVEAAKTYAAINRSIKTINVAEMEEENALLPKTLVGNVQRLVKVYNGVKPLLAVVTTLPLIPQAWRLALALFSSALEAVASSPEASADFKAGKDL